MYLVALSVGLGTPSLKNSHQISGCDAIFHLIINQNVSNLKTLDCLTSQPPGVKGFSESDLK